MKLPMTTRQGWHNEILKMLYEAGEPASPHLQHDIKTLYLDDLVEMDCIAQGKEPTTGRARNVYHILPRGEMYRRGLVSGDLFNSAAWRQLPELARLYLLHGEQRDAAIPAIRTVDDIRKAGGVATELLMDLCNSQNAYCRIVGILYRQNGTLQYIVSEPDGFHKNNAEGKKALVNISPALMDAYEYLEAYALYHNLTATVNSQPASAGIIVEMALLFMAENLERFEPSDNLPVIERHGRIHDLHNS